MAKAFVMAKAVGGSFLELLLPCRDCRDLKGAISLPLQVNSLILGSFNSSLLPFTLYYQIRMNNATVQPKHHLLAYQTVAP